MNDDMSDAGESSAEEAPESEPSDAAQVDADGIENAPEAADAEAASEPVEETAGAAGADDPFYQLGAASIPGKASVGENIRSEDSFSDLKDEVNKSASIASDEQTDWRVVEQTARKILESESKDMLVVGYYIYALLEDQGLLGLRDGFQVLRGVVEQHWDELYPPLKRKAGRRSAIAWLCESMDSYFSARADVEYEQADVDAVVAAMQATDEVLSEKDDEMEIYRAVKTIQGLNVRYEPEPEPEVVAPSEGADASGATEASAVGGVSAGPAVVDSTDSADEAEKQALLTLGKVIDFRYENGDFGLVNTYVFRRMILWVNQGDIAVNGVATPFTAPDPEVRQKLAEMSESSMTFDLLREAEKVVEAHPFWLDAHYYTQVGLIGMGEFFEPAKGAVNGMVGWLIQRYPGIETWTFSDGTPLADEVTQEWIASFASGGDAGLAEVEDGDLSDFSEQLLELQQLSGRKRWNMLMGMQHFLQSGINESDKVKLLIDTIEAFIDHGDAVCLPHYIEVLDRKLNYFHIPEWDKALGARALKVLIRAQLTIAQSAEDYLNQLVAVDPMAAIEIKS